MKWGGSFLKGTQWAKRARKRGKGIQSLLSFNLSLPRAKKRKEKWVFFWVVLREGKEGKLVDFGFIGGATKSYKKKGCLSVLFLEKETTWGPLLGFLLSSLATFHLFPKVVSSFICFLRLCHLVTMAWNAYQWKITLN